MKDFNSIKVQLEQENPREICVKLDNFNSIKVQLEPINAYVTANPDLFQFHKGTIRTILSYVILPTLRYFNSIKVQLEPKCMFSYF